MLNNYDVDGTQQKLIEIGPDNKDDWSHHYNKYMYVTILNCSGTPIL